MGKIAIIILGSVLTQKQQLDRIEELLGID